MARSEEALRRRALKRQHTEDEQRTIDWKDHQKNEQKKRQRLIDDGGGGKNQKAPGPLPQLLPPRKTTSSWSSSSTTTPRQVKWQQNGRSRQEEYERSVDKYRQARIVTKKDLESDVHHTRKDDTAVMKTNDHSDEEPPTEQHQQQQLQQQQRQQQRNNDHPKNTTDKKKIGGDDPHLKEEGAWICPSCHNSNYASRRFCNSKTCDERRPAHIPDPRKAKSRPTSAATTGTASRQSKPSRDRTLHSLSKTSVSESVSTWAPQAPTTTVERNQELRRRYEATNGSGEGMSPEDIERAKILIERAERKRIKKQQQQQRLKEAKTKAKTTANSNSGEHAVVETKKDDTKRENKRKRKNSKSSPSMKHKAVQDKNRALRKLYQETGGDGMSTDQVERAKLLLARDERKKQGKMEQDKDGTTPQQ